MILAVKHIYQALARKAGQSLPVLLTLNKIVVFLCSFMTNGGEASISLSHMRAQCFCFKIMKARGLKSKETVRNTC